MATPESPATKLKGTNISLDFDQIKDNLKQFLSSQDQFKDYDFEASGMSILLDVLAYNTQMNAMTAHLAMNELFLDSAQARPNIVALAKQLGYTPRSVSSSVAVINLTVTPPVSYVSDELVLREGIQFTGGGLTWYVTQSQTATKTDEGTFVFSNVNLREGKRKTVRYYYDSRTDYPRFEIPDRDVDTTTINVRVLESESSSLFTTYTKFYDFSSLTDSSAVYFLEENALGLYEIYFSGGTVGFSPDEGNIVEIEYFYSNGAASNGISVFSTPATISGSGEKRTYQTVTRATGGSDKESTESIRFNAPYFFEAQNRCVTLQDYAAIIRKELPQVESINVWGGEDNTPAEYGKVFISVKPTNGDTISEEQKRTVIEDIVGPRRVATVNPEILDPDYTYIGLDVVSKYDETKTTNSQQEVINIIRSKITEYGNTFLGTFDGVFRHSKLLTAIDNSELSITNTVARVYLIKEITISSSQDNEFFLIIPSDFYDFDPDDSFIRTTPIIINGQPHYITDRIDPANDRRRELILVYSGVGGEEIIENVDVGYIDLDARLIYIYGFRSDVDTETKIYINPKSYDIVPAQNQILRIDSDEVKVLAEKDFVKTYGSSGPTRFNPTPRNTQFFE